MTSKYTKDERMEIGRQVYEHHINRHQAAVKYDVSVDTIRDYTRLYKAALEFGKVDQAGKPYEDMTKEELIEELRKLKK